jgi:hypothetical protein
MQRFQRSFHFQCMSGRLVLEWPVTAVSYLVVSPRCLEIVSPSWCSCAWGRGKRLRGPNLVSKTGWGCCAWPRIPWHSGLPGMAHCRGAEARYRKTICEAVSNELHLEGVAEQLCRQSDSWSGIGEETRDAPNPPCQRKWSVLSWHLTGLASLSSFSACFCSSWHAVAQCSVWFCVRSWGTSFSDTHLIPRSCISITWHVPNDKLSSSAISLIVKRQFPWITALTWSTVSLVCAVDGRPVWIIVNGHVVIFKSGIPLRCLGPTEHCFSKCLL